MPVRYSVACLFGALAGDSNWTAPLQVPSFGMASYRGGHPKNNETPPDAYA